MTPIDGPATGSEGGKPTIVPEAGPLKGKEVTPPQNHPLNEGQQRAADAIKAKELAAKAEKNADPREALEDLADVGYRALQEANGLDSVQPTEPADLTKPEQSQEDEAPEAAPASGQTDAEKAGTTVPTEVAETVPAQPVAEATPTSPDTSVNVPPAVPIANGGPEPGSVTPPPPPAETAPNVAGKNAIEAALDAKTQDLLQKDTGYQGLIQQEQGLLSAGDTEGAKRVREEISRREQLARQKATDDSLTDEGFRANLQSADLQDQKRFIMTKANGLPKPEKNILFRAVRGIASSYDALIDKEGVVESKQRFFNLLKVASQFKGKDLKDQRELALKMSWDAFKDYAGKRVILGILRDWPALGLGLIAMMFIAPAYLIQKLSGGR